jgi:enterobactin synthetase component D
VRIAELVLPSKGDVIFIAGGSHGSLPVHAIRYDAALFDARMFDQSGIACPTAIRRSVSKRQAEYYHGRLCARRALAAMGIEEYTVHTGSQREPLWPSHVVGSITHNDEFAAAVVSPKGIGSMLGIDVERVVEGMAQEALIATVISVCELAYLRSLPPSFAFNLALTLVFSAKETFYKACFPDVGRFFDFDAVTAVTVDPVLQQVELRLNETLSARLAAGQVYRIDYHFVNKRTVLTVLHC